jgi:hypothetical protein
VALAVAYALALLVERAFRARRSYRRAHRSERRLRDAEPAPVDVS